VDWILGCTGLDWILLYAGVDWILGYAGVERIRLSWRTFVRAATKVKFPYKAGNLMPS